MSSLRHPLIWRACRIALTLALLLGVGSAAFAPYVYVEIWPRFHSSDPVSAAPVRLAKGRMIDDYFAVEPLGTGAYAIGEPRYYQANYSYLLVGTRRALLFDAGSGMRNIRAVVARITRLPVTVLPSHLHYDHVGGIAAFDHVALIDLPQTRARVVDGQFTPSRYQFLGMFDHLRLPTFRVAEWVRPGAVIDLGGRSIKVIRTPGHTPESISLWDPARHRLFTGDFIYPTMLYAFLPHASLSAYRTTAAGLLAELPNDTRFWAAHCCRRGGGYAAPWLDMGDLKALDHALARGQTGDAQGSGFFPRRYLVNAQMDLGTGFAWNNR